MLQDWRVNGRWEATTALDSKARYLAPLMEYAGALQRDDNCWWFGVPAAAA